MPELPEAETIKRDLAREITGQIIKDVKVYDVRVLGKCSPRSFIAKIKNVKVGEVSRRGKAIIIECNSKGAQRQWLVVQLGMTGLLLFGVDIKERDGKDIKVVFKLSGGKVLNYSDQRVFGRLTVVGDLNEVPCLKTIGPEPLNGSLAYDKIREQFKRRSIPVKTLLMDQKFIAGIGNIYASEILFSARIRPQKQCNRLTRKEIRSVVNAIPTVLNEAIASRGTSLRNYRDIYGRKGKNMMRLNVYDRDGQPCLTCRSPVKRLVLSGRSTFVCAECQR